MMSANPADLQKLVILDGGCSQHIFHERRFFRDDLKPHTSSSLGPGLVQMSHTGGIGTAHVICKVDGKQVEVKFTNAVYSPANSVNLVSETQLLDQGADLNTTRTIRTMTNGQNKFTCSRWYGLFVIDLWEPPALAMAAFNVPSETFMWHARMGHLGVQKLFQLSDVSTGMGLKRKRDKDDEGPDKDVCCAHCAIGRMCSRPHKGHLKPGETPLELIHTDLSGTINPRGYNGTTCYATFRDDKTMMSEVHPLVHKSDVVEKFKAFQARHERPPDRKIRRLRTNGGGEYASKAFQLYLKQCGIVFEPTARESPEQNPVSERINKEVGEKSRAMHTSGGISKTFWPEVVQTANYMVMRTPHIRLGEITPFQAWHNEKPDVSHIRTLGSIVFVRTVGHRAKLDDRSEPYVLVGFNENTNKHFRVIDPRAKRFVLMVKNVYDVHIEERTLTPLDNSDKDDPGDKIRDLQRAVRPQWDPDSGEKFGNHDPIETGTTSVGSSDPEPSTRNGRSVRTASPDPLRLTARDLEADQSQVQREEIQNLINDNPGLLFPDQSRGMSPDPLFFSALSALEENPNEQLYSLALVSFKNNPEPFEPKTHEEAMANEYFKMNWNLAEGDENGSLEENDTWELVTRDQIPAGATLLRGRWVYTLKRGADGSVIRYKARWVVRGFEQREGIDFNETFASVVKPVSYKVLFALAAANDWDLEQMDVKKAFLYGLIEEEVYVEQPQGWEKTGKNGEKLYCKLRKALYGLNNHHVYGITGSGNSWLSRALNPSMRTTACLSTRKPAPSWLSMWMTS